MTPTTVAGSAAAVPRGLEVLFLPETSRVAELRRVTAAHLRSWGLEVLGDSATLIVCELITKTIWHGRGHGAVNLMSTPCGQVPRIEVANPAPAWRAEQEVSKRQYSLAEGKS